MIPARYQASRFPAKLMQDLGGKPVIVRTYEAAVNTKLFNEVYVVTDSPIISDVIKEIGGNVIMSKTTHESGSDRIAEAVEDMDVDVVINVQGDEPFIDAESLEKIINVFKNDTAKEIDLGSLMTPITDWDEISNPNTVKVIVDHQDFALYFSRSPIPYPRDKEVEAPYYKHKGVYVFRKRALMDFKKLPMLPLEAKEKIEAIRFLEYGRKIKMVETHVTGIEIDTPEDLERARKIWK
ncbi:3-deoxy-manno-octulosonate cytidylyltransferase [Flagellimonas halotolerans]|uniref:3-deoxy-manno-octulosonate cytidylyltransferase n=1 Tax=Flagellimonas halotolerans TaxID=3112164 RepID=A0ABU6IRX8_9FLAO|nr:MULTISPECIES: 3-deoxy-manno-octulosonate cytidylyltransferase [unclassified Allomuricauda]MEC3965791.1 3-deoxy-manno-octulosonate cytidylyltransferase [Muricauda sp. SYSU M86414]MEC4265743.1 3-deoxy-manno-octulosonate cytidylyltransferase [Muricauda sp. SYSU M84420]